MSRQKHNNHLSTLCAMGYIICLPTGAIFIILTLLLNPYLNSEILGWIGVLGLVLIFFGGGFFILHFLFKAIEGPVNPVNSEDVLDDDLLES